MTSLTQTQIVRDQFTITTWICLGAVIECLCVLIVGRLAAVPALTLLSYRVVDILAQTLGWKHNSYMDGVILKKFAAQVPDHDGHYGNKPADSDIVVFLIGTRYNHPMALLASGVKELVGFFPKMVEELEAHAEEFGFLGMTSWLNSSDRATGSEIMMVCYFRTTEGLHAFAHSPFHRTAWSWWTHNTKKYPHLSIFHETYQVPKGNWESVYVNSHASGINTTTFKTEDEMTGR